MYTHEEANEMQSLVACGAGGGGVTTTQWLLVLPGLCGVILLVADRFMHLRERLVAVEAERDALRQQLAVVGVAAHGGDINDVPSDYCTDASNKVKRVVRILAALREPSATVAHAVDDVIYRDFGVRLSVGRARTIVRAAVAAAEREEQP